MDPIVVLVIVLLAAFLIFRVFKGSKDDPGKYPNPLGQTEEMIKKLEEEKNSPPQ